MLDFALVLALNDWEDEEKLTVFQLELLDRKLRALSAIINGKNLFSTEEAFRKFYSMETDFCKELEDVLERWLEMAEQIRMEQGPISGGGSSPGTERFLISRLRGGSSGSRDIELRFLQEEEAWHKGTEKLRMERTNILELDAGFVVVATWICGHSEEYNRRSGSGERQEKIMDRRGVG